MPDPAYTLHAIDDWGSLVVAVVLAELDVPHRIALKDFDAGDLDSAAFRALNPFGLIPVLETPDGPIFETGAILLWLGERHGLVPAPGSPDRAAFLKWFVLVNTTLHRAAMDMVHSEKPAGDAAAAACSAIARARVAQVCAALDAMISAESPDWLSAGRPCLLGHYIGMLLRWCAAFPAIPADTLHLSADPAPYPALLAVLRAHETSPAAQRAAALQGVVGAFYTAPT